MKIIHCSLWGDIEMSDLAISIIDTPVFQRLHDIRQNGFAFKVFPTATTTRFAHSIGVYHLTKIMIEHIVSHQPELPPVEKELLCIAGLCHDLGHGPFSHWFDQLLHTFVEPSSSWSDHENRSTHLFRHLVSYYDIQLNEEQVEFVCRHIHKPSTENKQWYNILVHNPESGIDTDKMDYLLRDVASFGLKFMYDPLRIIRNCRVIDNRICFCDRVRDEIFTLFHIRHKMYRFIYLHPTIQKFDQCFFHIIMSDPNLVTDIQSVMQNKNDVRFIRMTDSWLLQNMDQDLFDRATSRQWSFFEPFHLREFHDQQFGLMQNVHFFYRKNQDTSFTIDTDRFQDIGHMYSNLVSSPEYHHNHDRHDVKCYPPLPVDPNNSETGTQILYHP